MEREKSSTLKLLNIHSYVFYFKKKVNVKELEHTEIGRQQQKV